ncbi:MAG: hypothetical protein LBR55_01320 [Bacteroidales bacterium]|jgi:hypothetical protein|nr:hypothetical protein [Bacteroidales bacterium]
MDKKDANKKQYFNSASELEEHLKEISDKEQVYTIALFDILGFSNLVKENKTETILEVYQKLIDIVEIQKSTTGGESSLAGKAVPISISNDWKTSAYYFNINGFVNVGYFSDTFILYMGYNIESPWCIPCKETKKEPYPLLLGEERALFYPVIYDKHHLFLSFLQTCMEFFCQAIIAGIPLRGCVSTGLAIMNSYKSIFLGAPLVEVARGETAQNALGIAFGKSFNNSHPVYNDYFIPYLAHIKDESKKEVLSPMVLDWARYWRENFEGIDFKDCINRMNTNPHFHHIMTIL